MLSDAIKRGSESKVHNAGLELRVQTLNSSEWSAELRAGSIR